MSANPEYVDRFRRAFLPSVPSPLAVLVRGEGARVWDDGGREYLDFLAGIAVNALGHAHPTLVSAVSEQVARLVHVSNYYASEPELELAERLLRLTGGDGVFFGNSGTEANEAALKLARRSGRPRIVALEGGFHGRSTGALAITGQSALRAPFEPLIPGPAFIAPSLEALEAEFAAHGGEIAALFVEPIQGEAGVRDLPAGFLRRARELTAAHGALLILDEVQTGAGRTGEWFAYQHADQLGEQKPDAITLAKGIGGGVPIGALVAYGPAAQLLQPGQHGTTFGGNPLATAAANAVLGEIERAGLVANAARRGRELRAIIAEIDSPLVAGTSGAGLLLGVVLTRPVAGALHDAALAAGLIVNKASETRIRIAPPLLIGDAELADFRARFTAALAAVEPAAAEVTA